MDESRTLMFGTKGEKFLYRAAAVAVIDGRVLVQKIGDEDFLCLPGGRVEMGEPAEEALLREMREEMDCKVQVGRLLWVIDNLFTHRGVHYHELGLYFAISLPKGCRQASGEPWTGTELDGTKLYFSWHPADRLAELELRPTFLIEALRELPDHPQYVVHRHG